jgi:hypothetical protein
VPTLHSRKALPDALLQLVVDDEANNVTPLTMSLKDHEKSVEL